MEYFIIMSVSKCLSVLVVVLFDVVMVAEGVGREACAYVLSCVCVGAVEF